MWIPNITNYNHHHHQHHPSIPAITITIIIPVSQHHHHHYHHHQHCHHLSYWSTRFLSRDIFTHYPLLADLLPLTVTQL